MGGLMGCMYITAHLKGGGGGAILSTHLGPNSL